jgi:hypothetical protein
MLSTEFSSLALTRENSIETYYTPVEMRNTSRKQKRKKLQETPISDMNI